MKTWLIGAALILFLISHTVFVYWLRNIPMQELTKSNWRAFNYAFILSALYVFQRFGGNTNLQGQLIQVIYFVVIFTFVITLLVNRFLILNPYYLMAVVDIGTMLVTIFVLIAATNHGFLQD